MKHSGRLRFAMLTNSVYVRDARVRRYAEYLAEDGHEVHIFCLRSEDSVPQSGNPLISVHCLPMTRIRSEGFGLVMSWLSVFVRMFVLFSKLQLKYRYDLVHIHNMPDFLVFCSAFSKLRGDPVILNIHDAVPELACSKLGLPADHPVIRMLKYLERISIAFSDRVITPTKAFKNALVSRGIPSEKITILTNAADPRLFFSTPPGIGRKDSTFTLLYVGTVADRYGLDVCVRSLPDLRCRIPGIKLKILPKIRNEGKALSQCLALAEDLGVGDLLQVDDPVPLELMPEILRRADLGVYPARVNSHMNAALSLKIPEMAICGLPIIATRLQVLEDLYGADSIAFVPPEDPEAFACKVVELYESPELRLKLAQNAAEKSADLFWDNQYEIYRKLIENLLNRKLVKNGTG